MSFARFGELQKGSGGFTLRACEYLLILNVSSSPFEFSGVRVVT